MKLLDQIETQQLSMRRAKQLPLLRVDTHLETIGNDRPFYHSYRITVNLGKQVQYCESDRVDEVTKIIRKQLSSYIYGEIKELLDELELNIHAGDDHRETMSKIRELME
jgi:hypothetical protein